MAGIRQFVMFEHDFWKSGVVGRPTISLFIRKAAIPNVQALLCYDDQSLFRSEYLHYEYPAKYFNTVPFNRFRLFFSPIAMSFVQAIEMGSEPLNHFARITTGVRSKIGQKKIASQEKQGTTWKKGILSGSQVRPFDVNWQGDYLNIDKNFLFAGGWDATIVEKSKIMIRQTGDTIIAAIDEDKLYHLNNVHSLAPKTVDVSLLYLCALLNSKLMNRYYHLISLELGRTMAQTDIETLELLPIRQPNAEILREIETVISEQGWDVAQHTVNSIIQSEYDLTPEFRRYLEGDDLYPVQ
jgi:hypothetical protein